MPDPRWPQWLADLWGPEPEGPRRRAEDIERQNEAFRRAAEWRRELTQQEEPHA